tara:strand:+ start:26 stop:523 length:498 start_codon:yes stop_codon:yes gene_type:complete
MSTLTIFTSLIFILLVSTSFFFWQRTQIKNKKLRLRVLKGRRSIIGLSIIEVEKKLTTNPDLSMDVNKAKSELENSQNSFLMRNKNLLDLEELTRLLDVKANFIEKHFADLRKLQTTNQVKEGSTKDKTIVQKIDLKPKDLSPDKQRKTIEKELLDKISKLNKRD